MYRGKFLDCDSREGPPQHSPLLVSALQPSRDLLGPNRTRLERAQFLGCQLSERKHGTVHAGGSMQILTGGTTGPTRNHGSETEDYEND